MTNNESCRFFGKGALRLKGIFFPPLFRVAIDKEYPSSVHDHYSRNDSLKIKYCTFSRLPDAASISEILFSVYFRDKLRVSKESNKYAWHLFYGFGHLVDIPTILQIFVLKLWHLISRRDINITFCRAQLPKTCFSPRHIRLWQPQRLCYRLIKHGKTVGIITAQIFAINLSHIVATPPSVPFVSCAISSSRSLPLPFVTGHNGMILASVREVPGAKFFFLPHFCPWLKMSIYWRNKPQPHSCVCVLWDNICIYIHCIGCFYL